MKVTYLNHSGFLLEWPRCYWIFDYYRGQIPKLEEDKPLFVFCSHSHGDHFNPAVFGLASLYPQATYIFANQTRQACRKLERNPEGIKLSGKVWEQLKPGAGQNRPEEMRSGAESNRENVRKQPEGDRYNTQSWAENNRIHPGRTPVPPVIFLPNRTDTELEDGQGGRIRIHTLQSTDCGCGFFLDYEGWTVYHAGDLHWWTWPGESETENRKMTADYKKEMEYLSGRRIDLVFTPLDPRQEGDYGLGMAYLLGQVQAKHVFPMHFWGDFAVTDRYPEEYTVPEHTVFHRIREDGQSWEISE